VRIMRLEDEAVVEHARLVRGRVFLASNDRGPLVVPAAGQAVAFARRRQLRSALGSHLIVVVESRLEDAAGRVAASHLTALAIRVSRRTLRHPVPGAVTAVLQDLSPAAMVSLDPSYTAWRLDGTHAHDSFWESRLARERAIAAARCTLLSSGFQPGLFDTRAERANQAGNDRTKALADEIGRQLTAAEHAAFIAVRERVVLILVP